MPPKKRDKDNEATKNSKIDHLQADHELFLQAFESKSLKTILTFVYAKHFLYFWANIDTTDIISEPTQIYRFLRTRNMLSVSCAVCSNSFVCITSRI